MSQENRKLEIKQIVSLSVKSDEVGLRLKLAEGEATLTMDNALAAELAHIIANGLSDFSKTHQPDGSRLIPATKSEGSLEDIWPTKLFRH